MPGSLHHHIGHPALFSTAATTGTRTSQVHFLVYLRCTLQGIESFTCPLKGDERAAASTNRERLIRTSPTSRDPSSDRRKYFVKKEKKFIRFNGIVEQGENSPQLLSGLALIRQPR